MDDDAIDSQLAGLLSATNLNEHYAAAQEAAKGGRSDELYHLACALAARVDGVKDPPWQYRSLLERIVKTLALTPGRSNAERVAWLCTGAHNPNQPTPDPCRIRHVAALLASEQPVGYLLPLFSDLPIDPQPVVDLLACLAQELVLRRGQISDRRVEDVVKRLWGLGHPLAALPLRRLAPEGKLRLPGYGIGGTFIPLPFGPYLSAAHQQPGARTALPVPEPVPEPEPQPQPQPEPVQDITGPVTVGLMSSAVTNWIDDSNGESEAKVFRLRPATTETQALSAQLLSALPLQAFAGTTANDITVRPADAADVFTVLFSAAATGSAYGHGVDGAYARLYAWRSLAGLVGAGQGDDIQQTNKLAGRARYLLFSARSDWYQQVSWDIGIAAYRPDAQTLAILAATDTD